jgi:hypothetical protein
MFANRAWFANGSPKSFARHWLSLVTANRFMSNMLAPRTLTSTISALSAGLPLSAAV